MEVSENSVEKHADKILLSNLSEIGIKFATLIYDASENTGYNEFHSKCKSVLDAIKQTTCLIDYMVKIV